MSAQGTVVDDQGIPLEAATVTVVSASAASGTDQTVQTDSNGRFMLTLDAATPAVLRVDKAGYTRGFRAAPTAADNASAATRVVLLPVASTQTFDPTQAAVLRVPGSPARVELAASSLVREDGQPISGSTTVALTPIDPSADIARMPGLLVDGASGEPIESLGAMTVNFTDATGAPLNLASGQSATIRIPATPAAGATLPATFPLYHLNETTGRWTREGTATLQTDPGTGAMYYEGTVSHFSTWNADQQLTSATIDYGFDASGSRCVVPAAVRAAGVSYNGESYGNNRTVAVRINSTVRLTLYNILGEAVDSVVQSTPAVAGTTERIARCLVARDSVEVRGQVSVASGTLTGYMVQFKTNMVTYAVPIDGDGSYRTRMPKFMGDISARLVQTGFSRSMPNTSVSATVEGVDVDMPPLVVEDRQIELSGCVQGWNRFRQNYGVVTASVNGGVVDSQTVAAYAPNFAFLVPIDSTVTLRLTPPDGSLRERVDTVVVARAPLALAGCMNLPNAPLASMAVTGSGLTQAFDASASVAGDVPITSYRWNFGDGTTSTGATVTHTYAVAGVYTVQLTVTDREHQSTTLLGVVSTAATAISAVQSLDVGFGHGCALTDTGGLRCWGYNRHGQIGRGDYVDALVYGIESATPAAVDLGVQGDGAPIYALGMAAVSTGSFHSCAISVAGAVLCWGSNDYLKLGNTAYVVSDSTSPVSVSNIGAATAVSAGRNHTCALQVGGTVYCWGINDQGQLGVASSVRVVGGSVVRVSPAAVAPITGGAPTAVTALGSGNKAVVAGVYHTCAITAQDALKCWGYNGDGQLGDGGRSTSALPVQVAGLTSGVSAVAVGPDFTCAIVSGAVQCWGDDPGAQLRDVGVVSTPTTIPGLGSGASGIAVGSGHACAIVAGGELRCWGYNTAGQLGLGDGAFSTETPVTVPGLERDVVEVRAKGNATCARLKNGTVRCWGAWFYQET